MKIISFFIFIIFLIMPLCISAQVKGNPKIKPPAPKTQKMKGQLKEKPWTKSTQSYCAQGSDYLVLKNGQSEQVLENATQEDLKNYLNQSVTLSGYFQTRTIEPDKNGQHPIEIGPDGKETTSSFTCTVFVVQKIKKN